MADTGHAGTQAPQSMHSSGWMKSIGDCSNSASSLRGWMQSTGQTSTQAVSLVPMQGSVMMKGMLSSLRPFRRLSPVPSWRSYLIGRRLDKVLVLYSTDGAVV